MDTQQVRADEVRVGDVVVLADAFGEREVRSVEPMVKIRTVAAFVVIAADEVMAVRRSNRYVAPHGPDEPCTCDGCWACSGHEQGCTCDIDWDRLREDAS